MLNEIDKKVSPFSTANVSGAIGSALESVGTVSSFLGNINKPKDARMAEDGEVTHKIDGVGNTVGMASAGYNIGKNFGPLGGAIGAGGGALIGAIGSIIGGNKQPSVMDQLHKKNRFELNQYTKSMLSENMVPKQQLMAEDGMDVQGNKKLIEVEKDEVVLRRVGKGFKKVADFKGGKSHAQGGEDYMASEGDVIFPGKMRNKINMYLQNRRWSSIETERLRLPKDTDQSKMELGVQEIDPNKKVMGVQRSGNYTPVSQNYANPFDTVKETDPFGLKAEASLYKRQEGDIFYIPGRYDAENGDAKIPITKSLKGLSDNPNPEIQKSAKGFESWYTNPETLKRFGNNTGLDPKRLQDFVGKGLRTNVKKVGVNTLGRQSFGTYKDEENSNTANGEILYRSEANKDVDATIQHEYAHASKLDSVLGPKLVDTVGRVNQQKQVKGYNPERSAYMTNPQEAYGNFHGFRVKLGLKPGQKITKQALLKLVKEKQAEDDNFYQTYDDDNIVKAINTIAYSKESTLKKPNSNWLENYA